MRRRLFTLLSAMSLLLCVAALWVWIGSARHYLEISDYTAWRTDGTAARAEWNPERGFASLVRWEFRSIPGRLLLRRNALYVKPPRFVWIHPEDDPDFVLRYGLRPDDYAEEKNEDPNDRPQAIRDMGGWTRAGFGFSGIHPSRRPGISPDQGRSIEWEVLVPDWALTILFATLPASWIAMHLRRKLRRSMNLCQSCGYDLRATPERCPECGTVPPIAKVMA
jgi:hypothetical protein